MASWCLIQIIPFRGCCEGDKFCRPAKIHWQACRIQRAGLPVKTVRPLKFDCYFNGCKNSKGVLILLKIWNGFIVRSHHDDSCIEMTILLCPDCLRHPPEGMAVELCHCIASDMSGADNPCVSFAHRIWSLLFQAPVQAGMCNQRWLKYSCCICYLKYSFWWHRAVWLTVIHCRDSISISRAVWNIQTAPMYVFLKCVLCLGGQCGTVLHRYHPWAPLSSVAWFSGKAGRGQRVPPCVG